MSPSEHDRREILFVAMTRPSLIWGVPLEAFMANVLVTFLAGLELQAPTLWRSPMMFWAMGVPVHFVLRRLTDYDFHWFRTIRLWCLTTGTGRTTLESLPTQRPRSWREVGSSG